jgi:hypothetical protein
MAPILWRNGMCGLEDHDCRARKQARQGRVGSNRTAEQPNNRISTRPAASFKLQIIIFIENIVIRDI